MTGGSLYQTERVVLNLSCFLLLVLLCSGLPGQDLWESSLPSLLFCRELYSQFLREMIIQPGIAKANMGVSREDVTFEDHVSRGQQWGLRLQSGGGVSFGVGKVPSPQRIGTADLGPLWPFWYLFSSFVCSVPEGCCLSPLLPGPSQE